MNGQKYLTENDVFAAAPDAASNFWEMHHSRFFKSIFNLEKKNFFWFFLLTLTEFRNHTKKSHSTLRAERTTFTVNQCYQTGQF